MDNRILAGKIDELERLLSEMSDQGPSESLIAKLQSLLLDQSELQQHYVRFVGMQTLLSHEFQHASPQFAPLKEVRSRSSATDMVTTCGTLAAKIGSEVAIMEASNRRRRTGWIALAAVAASIALIAGGSLFLRPDVGGGQPGTVAQLGSTEQHALESSGADSLVVRDPTLLRLLSRVTKTSLLTNMELPVVQLLPPLQPSLRSGIAWMQKPTGLRERGYVVAIEPDCTLDLYVDAEASGHNNLAVVELDWKGEATGEAVSFSNRHDPDPDDLANKVGSIGSWSKHNGTDRTKYYLLTGSHVLLQHEATDDAWQLSDFSVLLESEALVHIGWDDSGYQVPSTPDRLTYRADRDFDDVNATIHIRSAKQKDTTHVEDVKLMPVPSSDAAQASDIGAGYGVSVASGETLVLRVTSDSWLPNRLTVVDAETGSVIWQYHRTKGRPISEATVDLGAYLIENRSGDVRNYVLVTHHGYPEETLDEVSWKTSPFNILEEEEENATIGFNDAGPDEDWNDIQVHMRWLRD